MFFGRNVPYDDLVHHAQMSERAITVNVVVCVAWVMSLVAGSDRFGFGAAGILFAFLEVLVVVAALYVHLSGVAYSVILAKKCKLRNKAVQVFVVSGVPLVGLSVFLVWVGT
jgi:hypothetical protein